MKKTRSYLIIWWLWYLCSQVSAQLPVRIDTTGFVPIEHLVTKVLTLKYTEGDFDFNIDADSLLHIVYHGDMATYSGNITEPSLPFLHYYVLVNSNQGYKDISIQTHEIQVSSGIEVAPNEGCYTTDSYPVSVPSLAPSYVYDEYPLEAYQYTGSYLMGGHRVISFCICPFRYDSTNRKLFLRDSIAVNLKLNSVPTAISNIDVQHNEEKDRFVQNLIVNKEDFANSTANHEVSFKHEYLIITSSELAEAFEPLVKWKRMRGLAAKVVTTEDIYNRYSDITDNKLKIKTYLRNYYDSCAINNHKQQEYAHSLEYVLLGGDDMIVPACSCYMEVQRAYLGEDGHTLINTTETDFIPTDLYYACLNGDLDWGISNDTIYGSNLNKINLSPNIVVTRLPVRGVQNVSAYLKKLIQYEANPSIKDCHNNLLMGGLEIARKVDTESGESISDSQNLGELIYNNYVLPYWSGERKRLYDTYTDFDEENFSYKGFFLQKYLSQGFSFVDIATHGSPYYWALEPNAQDYYKYGVDLAFQLNNSTPTLISTIACNTNGFDREPCLSEGFIRNPNSGVLGYYGSTRIAYSWGGGKVVEGTFKYVAEYMKHLFLWSDDLMNHYGTIIKNSKQSLISTCANFAPNLWMMYSFNAMGDPEMPIYLTAPKHFQGITIDYSNKTLRIETNVHTYFLSAVSLLDDGETYFYNNRVNGWSKALTDLPKSDICVCVQAPDYVPFIFRFRDGNVYLQNAEMLGVCNIKGANVIIDNSLFPNVANKSVSIEGNTTIKARQNVTVENGLMVPKGSSLIIQTGVQ